MRYAALRSLDISNGEGIGASLFVQGCSIRCPGCFQPQTWDFNGGKSYTQETKEKILELVKPPHIERFSILGGEPLEEQNWFELACLINSIKQIRPDIKIWVYSGYEAEDLLIKSWRSTYLKYILDNIDVLVAGPFIQEEQDLSLPWCGSRNQKIVVMKEGSLDC